jgi:hypothetical protein
MEYKSNMVPIAKHCFLQKYLFCVRMMDLFSGAGGLSAGLEASGVARSLWGVEWSTEAAEAYQLNHTQAQASDYKCRLWLRYCGRPTDISQYRMRFGFSLLSTVRPCSI